MSLVHTVEPWGKRHITQVTSAFEVLRPNLKDVLYQLEANTFKEGFLWSDDHAGFGVLATRLGQAGNPRKGPVGFGLRVQDSFRLGPFQVEATSAKVMADGPTGGRR